MLIKTAGQQTIKETLQKKAAYAPPSKNAKDLNESLAHFIWKDIMPFLATENGWLFKIVSKTCVLFVMQKKNLFFNSICVDFRGNAGSNSPQYLKHMHLSPPLKP